MLNDFKSSHDLLDKKSKIYSSRPRVVMGGECVSKGLRTLLMPYGNQWRTHQRLQASVLNIRTAASYKGMQDIESRQLIAELLSTSDFAARFHRYSSSLIYSLAYGKRLVRGDEPEVQGIDRVMENFLYAARVGTWIVDAWAVLNVLPTFMAPWKQHAENMHAFESQLYVQNMKSAETTRSWNWVKQVKGMKESQGMSELELAYDVGILYEAGSDTTTMAMEVFTMAAVLYPNAMKAARDELDSIVGRHRLPTFDDSEALPHVNAVIKEVLRWRPVSAGGIPHAVIEDDEYMGYRIPKGSVVIGNHWAIHLDEEVFENALTFDPERWIRDPDLPFAPFGFGRRICTGQHIAKNSLFINIARILWAYDVGHAYEENNLGAKLRCEIDPLAMTQGFNSRPMPFKAVFTVRGAETRDVIEKNWESAEKDVEKLLADVQLLHSRKSV
ncbi:hypothetical protein LTR27_009178 [Elasticomyces elasticus]|nr:hypothetical protein LTR27_009178 [Elasticomyces elasticus]